MAITPPKQVPLSPQQVRLLNPVPIQSALISASTSSSSVTFTNIPSTNRVTFMLANTGTTAAYIAAGSGSATAVVPTSTPSPTSGTGVQANSITLDGGATVFLDFLGTIDTIAAITASGTTSVGVSICM